MGRKPKCSEKIKIKARGDYEKGGGQISSSTTPI